MKMSNLVSDLNKKLDDALMRRENAEKLLDYVQNRASSKTITLGNINL